MVVVLSMASRKDHAKSRKSDLPYVTNSLNILLYDVSLVKINVYYDIFAVIPKLKSDWSHFFLLTKYVKRLDIRTHYLL
jgi:hypothetical protein